LDRIEIRGDRGRYGVSSELDDLTREQVLTEDATRISAT